MRFKIADYGITAQSAFRDFRSQPRPLDETEKPMAQNVPTNFTSLIGGRNFEFLLHNVTVSALLRKVTGGSQ